jgi:integrase
MSKRRGAGEGSIYQRKDGALHVRHQLQRIDGKPQLTEPKSASSKRTVVLPAFALEALRQRRIRQFEERLVAGDDWRDMGLVFTSTNGGPLDDADVRRVFRAILKKAGLPPMRIHDLRHGCATLLLAQGAHPRAVMALLGHSEFRLTMNTHSHVLPAVMREVAERMERAVGGAE